MKKTNETDNRTYVTPEVELLHLEPAAKFLTGSDWEENPEI